MSLIAAFLSIGLANAGPVVVVKTPTVHVRAAAPAHSHTRRVVHKPTAMLEILSVQALNEQDGRGRGDEIYLMIDGRRVTNNLHIHAGQLSLTPGRDTFRLTGTQTVALWESDPSNWNDDLIGNMRISAAGPRGVATTVEFVQRGTRYRMTYVLR